MPLELFIDLVTRFSAVVWMAGSSGYKLPIVVIFNETTGKYW